MKIYFKTSFTILWINYLLSSSNIVTVAWPGLLRVTLDGKELRWMTKLNVSLASTMLSSLIATSKWILVSPAGNVTEYGPEP